MTYTDHSHNISGHYIGSHTHTFNPSSTTTTTFTTLYCRWCGGGHSSGQCVWMNDKIDAATLKMLNLETKQKEPEMTTLEKVRRERQEAIERKKIEAMYTDYDELDLESIADGVVFRFDWERDDHKTYTYAALKAKDHWYVTGGSAPNGLATEDFVAWLIGKKIAAVALVEMVPAS